MEMVEEEAKELPSEGSEDGALPEHIAHWVDVLDRWVKRIDLDMGGRIGAGRVGEGDGLGDVAEDVGSTKGVEG